MDQAGNNTTYAAIGSAGQAVLAFLDGDNETALRKIDGLERSRVPGELRYFVDEIEENILESGSKSLLPGGSRD